MLAGPSHGCFSSQASELTPVKPVGTVASGRKGSGGPPGVFCHFPLGLTVMKNFEFGCCLANRWWETLKIFHFQKGLKCSV